MGILSMSSSGLGRHHDHHESVVEAVQEDKLTPIEGVSILACTTGQLLGYQAFHGQPQPAELLFPYFSSK
jgi:hypothetical protein